MSRMEPVAVGQVIDALFPQNPSSMITSSGTGEDIPFFHLQKIDAEIEIMKGGENLEKDDARILGI